MADSLPTPGPLTLVDALLISNLISGLDGPIKYLVNEDTDSIFKGVARTITQFDGESYSGSEDIRQQYLHVSGTVEMWIPVHEVLRAMMKHTFVFGK